MSKPEVARLRMLIGGEWRLGQAERDVIDPYRSERAALLRRVSERLVLFNL